MAEACSTDLSELLAGCDAVRKRGGVKKRVWIGRLADITYTTDGDGYVDDVTLAVASPPNLLYKYIGRKFKHNGTLEGVIGENFNSITHNVNLLLYYYSPEEKAAIEKLFNAEDVVAFVELEAGQIEIWGLDTGLNASALSGGTGTAFQDSTALTVTLSGAQDTLPKEFRYNSSATLQDSIDALDALT